MANPILCKMYFLIQVQLNQFLASRILPLHHNRGKIRVLSFSRFQPFPSMEAVRKRVFYGRV
jgi:hypothetical protein